MQEQRTQHTIPLQQPQPQLQQQHEEENDKDKDAVPLMALNHVSRMCGSVEESVKFYVDVLGFVLVNRPPSFNFDGAWLFNYGVGIHLLQKKNEEHTPQEASPDKLDPVDNHISFQCEDMEKMERRLKDMNIKYMKRTVGNDNDNDDESDNNGLSKAPTIDQLFFNDPDGYMIEICNCENLKLIPADSLGRRIKLPRDRHVPPVIMNTSQ